jgi:ATP/maltotriose-dependent transcriptional regulator MalT
MAAASLALDTDRPSEAEKLARDAAHQFESSHDSNPEASAYAVLARSLVAQGKIPEAQAAAAHAASVSRNIATRPPRFDAVIASAVSLAATGNSEGARKKLSAVLAEARAFGYVTYELQARFEASAIEMTSSPTAAARTRLGILQKEARNRGFLLIARKAASLEAQP